MLAAVILAASAIACTKFFIYYWRAMARAAA
jgi:hypothetical protein